MYTLHYKTPTYESLPLKQLTGKTVWLKMECFQPTGSFKLRGIGRLCQYWINQGKKQFVSASGGNAGIATAYAGRKLGAKVTVFLPKSSKPIYIDALKLQGADVIIHGEVWDEANEAALHFAEINQAAYIPPFDHPLLWEGHATMIDEVAAEGIKPDAVITSVGGGGLACGVLMGMHQHGWNDVPLFTVETKGAASFAEAVAANKLITLPKIETIATTLGAKRVAEELFNWRNKHPIKPLVVSDKDAVDACRRFVDDHRALIEPASGASLSVVYNQRPELKDFSSILVIVCGGSGISLDLLNEYSKTASV